VWLALPGFRPIVKFQGNVRLQMMGNLPEIQAAPLLETRVRAMSPTGKFDAEMNLETGRILLSTANATAKSVRVHVLEESFDIDLPDSNSEVVIDRVGNAPSGTLLNRDELVETPRILVYIGVHKGSATIRHGFKSFKDVPAGSKFKWDNKGTALAAAPVKDDDDATGRFGRVVALPKEPSEGYKEFKRRVLTGRGMIDVEFASALNGDGEPIAVRTIAPMYLQSTDHIEYLIMALENDSAAIRDSAVRALRHWCAQSADREAALQTMLADKKNFPALLTQSVISMLRGSTLDKAPADAIENVFGFLRSESLLVREVARTTLANLDLQIAKDNPYDANGDKRDTQANKWQTALAKKKK
jgi:hypothetical protein